jgi:hypothetical protein
MTGLRSLDHARGAPFHDLTLEVDRRFTLVDRRLEGIQTEMDARFREVFGHFDELYRRLGG